MFYFGNEVLKVISELQTCAVAARVCETLSTPPLSTVRHYHRLRFMNRGEPW